MNIRGSALITALLTAGLFLLALIMLFTFLGLLQTQIARAIASTQIVSLGNSGLNHALARFRLDKTYTGEAYHLSTGDVDTYVATYRADPTKKELTARAYAPGKSSGSRICEVFRVVVDPTTTPPSMVPKTYQEMNDPLCGAGGPTLTPTPSGSPSPSPSPTGSASPTPTPSPSVSPSASCPNMTIKSIGPWLANDTKFHPQKFVLYRYTTLPAQYASCPNMGTTGSWSIPAPVPIGVSPDGYIEYDWHTLDPGSQVYPGDYCLEVWGYSDVWAGELVAITSRFTLSSSFNPGSYSVYPATNTGLDCSGNPPAPPPGDQIEFVVDLGATLNSQVNFQSATGEVYLYNTSTGSTVAANVSMGHTVSGDNKSPWHYTYQKGGAGSTIPSGNYCIQSPTTLPPSGWAAGTYRSYTDGTSFNGATGVFSWTSGSGHKTYSTSSLYDMDNRVNPNSLCPNNL